LYVERFWTTYDDLIIMAIFTQIGIVFRLAAAMFFDIFNDVFSNDSPLFVNLPLNCLSCFIFGALCSGEQLMEVIATRFSPARSQQEIHAESFTNEHHEYGSDAQCCDDLDEHEAMPVVDTDENTRQRGVLDKKTASSRSSRFRRENERGSGNGDVGRKGQQVKRRAKRSRQLSCKPTRFQDDLRSRNQQPALQTVFRSWFPSTRLNDELRDVQLLALERRIRASKCLLLFPLRKQDVDVMEHYFDVGYKRQSHSSPDELHENIHTSPFSSTVSARFVSHRRGVIESDLALTPDTHEEELGEISNYPVNTSIGELERLDANQQAGTATMKKLYQPHDKNGTSKTTDSTLAQETPSRSLESESGNSRMCSAVSQDSIQQLDSNQPQDENLSVPELDAPAHPISDQIDIDQLFYDMTTNVSENVARLRRVNLADGWDIGTSTEAMSDDLILGLRAGFCGALSSFSSWNSAMVNLMKKGNIGQAIVGYIIGIQLPIVAYRFGQHVAVYIFIWRARQETRSDERRGYGIRVSLDEDSERQLEATDVDQGEGHVTPLQSPGAGDAENPSVRAIATATFLLFLVTECTSMFFFSDPENQVLAISLLFSPLGVYARWRLSRLNSWRPTFPIGTFAANILACALGGSLGEILAGNPKPRQRIVLQGFINGFGGTLSSVAAFLVEVLAGLDPILLRLDGIVYALLTLFWAIVTGFIFSASSDWADQISQR
jgi:fluoride ion exporter CrcB/FEX